MKGCRLLQDFIMPALRNKTYGENLKWDPNDKCVFMLKWIHKAKASWSQDDAAVFLAWDKLKNRPLPRSHLDFVNSKQRLRAALRNVKTVQEVISLNGYRRYKVIGLQDISNHVRKPKVEKGQDVQVVDVKPIVEKGLDVKPKVETGDFKQTISIKQENEDFKRGSQTIDVEQENEGFVEREVPNKIFIKEEVEEISKIYQLRDRTTKRVVYYESNSEEEFGVISKPTPENKIVMTIIKKEPNRGDTAPCEKTEDEATPDNTMPEATVFPQRCEKMFREKKRSVRKGSSKRKRAKRTENHFDPVHAVQPKNLPSLNPAYILGGVESHLKGLFLNNDHLEGLFLNNDPSKSLDCLRVEKPSAVRKDSSEESQNLNRRNGVSVEAVSKDLPQCNSEKIPKRKAVPVSVGSSPFRVARKLPRVSCRPELTGTDERNANEDVTGSEQIDFSGPLPTYKWNPCQEPYPHYFDPGWKLSYILEYANDWYLQPMAEKELEDYLKYLEQLKSGRSEKAKDDVSLEHSDGETSQVETQKEEEDAYSHLRIVENIDEYLNMDYIAELNKVSEIARRDALCDIFADLKIVI